MKNRIFTVLLAGILCLSNVFSVFATELAEDGLDARVGLSTDSTLDTEVNEENNQAEEYQSYVSSDEAMNATTPDSSSKKTTKYNIKFFGNGSTSGKMDVVKNIKSDKAVTLPKNKFKKTGFVFVCWNTKIDGSGKAYTNGQKVKGLSKKDGATVNLYAMWSLKKAPDMSEYIKKSEVQKIVDTAVSQAVAEAVKNIEVEGVQGPKGDKGDPGRGIKSTAIDKDGNLIVTYTDGEKVNVGVVKGESVSSDWEDGTELTNRSEMPADSKNTDTVRVDSIKITKKHCNKIIDEHTVDVEYTISVTGTYDPNDMDSFQNSSLSLRLFNSGRRDAGFINDHLYFNDHRSSVEKKVVRYDINPDGTFSTEYKIYYILCDCDDYVVGVY